MAFGGAFDIALFLKENIKNMTSIKTRFDTYTDSLSLFNILTSAKIPTKKRLKIVLFCIKSFYGNGYIGSVFLTCSEYNLAVATTKKQKRLALLDTFESRKIHHTIEQWVNRKASVKTVDEKSETARKYSTCKIQYTPEMYTSAPNTRIDVWRAMQHAQSRMHIKLSLFLLLVLAIIYQRLSATVTFHSFLNGLLDIMRIRVNFSRQRTF